MLAGEFNTIFPLDLCSLGFQRSTLLLPRCQQKPLLRRSRENCPSLGCESATGNEITKSTTAAVSLLHLKHANTLLGLQRGREV